MRARLITWALDGLRIRFLGGVLTSDRADLDNKLEMVRYVTMALSLDDDCGVMLWRVLAAKYFHRRNPAFPVRDGPDVDDDYPVFDTIDKGFDACGQPHAIFTPQEAREYAELQGAAERFRELMHCA